MLLKAMEAINQIWIENTSRICRKMKPIKQEQSKKEGVQHTKARLGEYLKKKWESKVMHGQ